MCNLLENYYYCRKYIVNHDLQKINKSQCVSSSFRDIYCFAFCIMKGVNDLHYMFVIKFFLFALNKKYKSGYKSELNWREAVNTSRECFHPSAIAIGAPNGLSAGLATRPLAFGACVHHIDVHIFVHATSCLCESQIHYHLRIKHSHKIVIS